MPESSSGRFIRTQTRNEAQLPCRQDVYRNITAETTQASGEPRRGSLDLVWLESVLAAKSATSPPKPQFSIAQKKGHPVDGPDS